MKQQAKYRMGLLHHHSNSHLSASGRAERPSAASVSDQRAVDRDQEIQGPGQGRPEIEEPSSSRCAATLEHLEHLGCARVLSFQCRAEESLATLK